MIVVPEYRGFRIDVNAIAVDRRRNADVRILRLFSQEKPHVDIVTCLKVTATHAESAGEIWARAANRVALVFGPMGAAEETV
jgi:hypothetical protein